MSRRGHSARQTGQALIALVAIVVLAASWMLVQQLNMSTADIVAAKRARNTIVLQQAKQAVVGWVALQAAKSGETDPGRLPCPESTSAVVTGPGGAQEGSTAGTCSDTPAIGRFPWRTVGTDKLVDADGEPLWFVVSTGWKKANASLLTINSNSQGQITVDGVANAAVALIIAPGPAINAQGATGCTARNQQATRTAPAPNINPLDYLECYDAASASFVTSAPAGATNDQVMVITVADVMPSLEAAIAERMVREVVPHLQTAIYNTAQWGASAAAPIYPFPARFSSGGTFNPDNFEGSSSVTQGLLPVSAYSCSGIASTRCDPNFVRWNTGTVAASVTNAGSFSSASANCAASSASQVSCTFSYSKTCFDFAPGTCTTAAPSVSVQGNADNVGMTMRTVSMSPISTNIASPTLDTPINSAGAAVVQLTGTLATASCTETLFFIWWTCTASGSVTVTMPITIFADNAFLNPSTSDEWYWFFQNKWHELTYYAVAPRHLPSGSPHDCSAVTANCITINLADGTTQTNRQAVLVLAGRSLNGSARPSGTLGDYLDSAENTDGNTTFEQKTPGRSFNDHVVTIANY